MALLDVGDISPSTSQSQSTADQTSFGGNISFGAYPQSGNPFGQLQQLALPAIVLLGAYLLMRGAK